MTIAITGATGHLGRLVVSDLLDRGLDPGDIVAAVRSPEKASDLVERGVQVRPADYDQPGLWPAALKGVDRLLLISSSEVGSRVPQHRTVIAAAAEAGVGSVAYTSIIRAATTGLALAAEHRATEELLAASGIPHTLLRHSWYLENYTANLATYTEHGTILGTAGSGLVSGATRADFAAGAAAVLTTDGHVGAVYELGGDPAFSLADLAAAASRATGTTITYTDLPFDEYVAALVAAGLPEPVAQMLADADDGIRRGDLHTDTGDLTRLIGRPTTSPQEAFGAAAG
jgi:NAD(P)H dehydrogenase (quinone)